MIRTMALATFAVAALLGPGSDPTIAGTLDGWIDRADKAAAAENPAEVGRCLGKAARLAHAARDLRAEARVTLRIRTLVWGRHLSFMTSEFDEIDRTTFLAALVPLMSELDPRHGGVFVSAHDLAYEILAIGTRTGVRTGLVEAARVADRWKRTGRAGQFGRVLHDYARGLLAVRPDGDTEAGLAALTRALDACRKHGWREMGALLTCEIACVHLARGDRTTAEAVLDGATWTIVGPRREGPFWQSLTTCIEIKRIWRWMLAARVGPIDPKLHVRFANALAGVAVTGGNEPPTVTRDPGYRHGGVAKGGRNALPEDRERLLARVRTGRAILTVRRRAASLMISTLGGAEVKRVGVLDGQESWAFAGIRVGTYFANVCVQTMDFDPRGEGSFGGSSRDEAKCWYLLAHGEKMIVTRCGVIVR